MISALRHKIELLSASRTHDDGGGAVVSWAPGPELWARVERLTSTRDLAGDRENRLRRLAVTVRYRSDLILGHRIRLDSTNYEIVSIETGDERDRRLTLICEEVLS